MGLNLFVVSYSVLVSAIRKIDLSGESKSSSNPLQFTMFVITHLLVLFIKKCVDRSSV